MAEAVGLASGLITLVIFAHKSSVTLYTTIKSFKSQPRHVRDLIAELKELNTVLESLTKTTNSSTDADFSGLEIPLQRCGHACEEFLQELQKTCTRSGADRTSFRDWAKLKYMGDDIDDFRDSLAACKSTINVALTGAQLRKSSATLDSLQDQKTLIETAKNDLEARLETIDEKLEAIISRTATESEATDFQRIKEEHLSTQKCLSICAQVSNLIDQLQPIPPADGPDNVPGQIMSDGMQKCRVSLEQTTKRLEKHMQDILDQMVSRAGTPMSKDDIAHLTRLREEWATTRQCRDILQNADRDLKENVSIIDNHATGDEAVQFLVSNSEKTIHGKNRGFGYQIRQLGGHLSDQSIQKVSGDFLQMSLQSKNEKAFAKNETLPSSQESEETLPNWRPEYGSGRTMKPQPGLQPKMEDVQSLGIAKSDRS